MLLLGIPFHISEMYRISGGWVIDSGEQSFLASLITAVVHSFRMPGFFILAGFFAAMLLDRRSPKDWMKNRLTRLLIPLLASLLALGGWEVYWANLGTGMTSAEAFADTLTTFPFTWVNHRWFIVVLLVYCCAIALYYTVRASLPDRFHSKMRRLFCHPFAVLVFLPLVAPFAGIVLAKVLGNDITGPYLRNIVSYAPLFFAGAVIFQDRKLYDAIFQPGAIQRLLAVLLLLIYCLTYFAFYKDGLGSGWTKTAATVVHLAASGIGGVLISSLFFFYIFKFFDKPNPIIRYFVSGSLVMYLAHEAFFRPMGVIFQTISFSAELEMLIINVLTLVGVVLTFEIVRRYAVTRYLFNGGSISPPLPDHMILTSNFRADIAKKAAKA
ncbi:hypothetical protein AYJ57_07550 [Salipiger sp. CCB-MM3]|nr:hypothetical protein AYJ57_07550 [Salipiger sp. CCB-MM3]